MKVYSKDKKYIVLRIREDMDKRNNSVTNENTRNKKINKIILKSGIVAIVFIIAFSIPSIKFLPNANAAAVPIDNIKCESLEGTVFHIHAKLDIFINGQNFTLPALIGITNDCLYWMHTHDETGIIHIESPIQKNFTLGEFFDIWKQKLSNNQVLNYTTDSNHPLNVYVNGTKTPNGVDFRTINIHAHDVIAIVYGTPPPNIVPAKADFSAVDP
jgi:hypothetical protein